MNPNHDLERHIADHYLTEAPVRAPDWLLVRTMDAVDTTPQRRTWLGRPWRIPSMPVGAGLAGAAVAIVVVGGLVLTVQQPATLAPGASPEPTALPPTSVPAPLTERFDSTFNGISMNYPAGWQARPATEPWTSRALNFDDAGVDVFFDPELGEALYLAVASELLADVGYREWPGTIEHGCAPLDEESAVYTLTLDPGIPHAYFPGCAGSMLITTETRGFAIVRHLGDGGLADTYGDEWFQSVLDTVELHPEAADPSPSVIVGPSDAPG